MTADRFASDDAAYVLGALDDADRAAFEQHLLDCADCRQRVAQARATADLLAGLPADALDGPGGPDGTEPPPDTLLPGLLRAARRERTRRRAVLAGLAAAAAACAAALVVVLWPAGSSAPVQAARSFVAVRPSPVQATGRLVSHAWGTEIRLHCRYSPGVVAYLPYDLVVVDSAGRRHPAGSWTLAPGTVTDFTGGTAVPRDRIAQLQITRPDGTAILALPA